jgi:Mg-chelatase subunit ChlI
MQPLRPYEHVRHLRFEGRIGGGPAVRQEEDEGRRLPIGVTEDRVVGTLNIERAIREGVRALEPGLLAEVNQNVLYIDEINLLPDHITESFWMRWRSAGIPGGGDPHKGIQHNKALT